ncbi:OpgC domain-containing protein, partial [Candidatus Saccharibacteria bacterium]|nr:OpgC domain-containing protein [Candidatus Saccharibacteria bacterium]
MPKKTDSDIAVVTQPSKRILSIDIIRGFLLIAILIGHIELPPNFYDYFTGRGRLFVSAAEGFFFMSGLLVGMVYKRKLSHGMKYIFKKMWTRAAELYIASVILTLTYAFIVARTNHFYIKQGLPNPVDWSHIVTQTLLLRFDYGWADFLNRFAILMLIAPVVFYFIAKGRWKLVLFGVISAYLLRRDNFTLGWQILFNIGMLIGFYWEAINSWWRKLNANRKTIIKQSLFITTAITFIYSYSVVYVLSELNTFMAHLPLWLQHASLSWDTINEKIWTYADKWTMGPVRLILFFVWGTVAYFWVTKRELIINRRTKGVLLLIGQNSLFVYIFHSIIVFGFKFAIPAKTNPIENFIIVSLGL